MPRRAIPSIEQLRQRPAIRALEARFGAAATLGALRAAAAELRETAGHDDNADCTVLDLAAVNSTEGAASRIEASVSRQLIEQFTPSLAPVINATGVVLHTNLGRAPLADTAIARMALVAAGYTTLEYDASTGTRGRRDVHAEALLQRLTGAAAAVVVNNNAAATLLLLAALAAGREVIVSRGELVEIGGGFRVPDVMAQSGAILREVGTTNKTRAADYAAAISERTAMILRIHPSNFRLEGFAERPTVAELAAIARHCHVPLAEDLGSGFLAGPRRSAPAADRARLADAESGGRLLNPALTPHPLARREPAVEESLADGVDICCFSGDKLLGGPQAGIVAGRGDLVERVRRHPLMRALRVDKVTYAALEATLIEYAAGRAAITIPVQRMLRMTADEIRVRADVLAAKVASMDGWRAEVVAGDRPSAVGARPAWSCRRGWSRSTHAPLSPDALDAQLRALTPPIVARIEHDRVLLDLRTVFPAQDEELAGPVAQRSVNRTLRVFVVRRSCRWTRRRDR